MPKRGNQKRKLLVLARMLLKHSDEEHPVTLGQLQEELERWDAPAERKSIYDDMEQLRQLGLDVQARRGAGGGWFVGQREFELAELKLLVDAVQSSRFLTQRKSNALIRKLESLASEHQARQLQRQVYVDRRIKTMNESIFYNVDRLHGAIAANRVITFRYFEVNMAKERVYRREGSLYRVTPYGLIQRELLSGRMGSYPGGCAPLPGGQDGGHSTHPRAGQGAGRLGPGGVYPPSLRNVCRASLSASPVL